jgi:hypothetical protein
MSLRRFGISPPGDCMHGHAACEHGGFLGYVLRLSSAAFDVHNRGVMS